MLFSIFVNRRGRVTTLSLLINALVISTFLPVAVGAENFHGVLTGDGIMPQPQPSRFHLANALLPSPMQDALFSLTPKEEPASPAIMPPLKSPLAFPRNLFSPLPDNSTFESSEPEADTSEQEKRMRLARFLPEDTQHAGLLSSMDGILAKALESQTKKSTDSERILLAYLQGDDDAIAESSPDPTTETEVTSESDTLLAEGNTLFEQDRLQEAFLTYFDVVSDWPESTASDTLDNLMNSVYKDTEAWTPRVEELRLVADQLPAYKECASDKAVLWLITINQVVGQVLSSLNRKNEATPYLTQSCVAALAAMNDLPHSQYQVFIPDRYLDACRELGRDDLKIGMKTLSDIINRQGENNILKLASRIALTLKWRKEFHDIEEAGMHSFNVLDEYSGSEAALINDSGTASPNVLAHLDYMMGYTYYQQAMYLSARSWFTKVTEEHPEIIHLADTAGYMTAFMTELIEAGDPDVELAAYYTYMEKHPDGFYIDKALLRMAAILHRAGRLSDTAATYRQAAALFPDAPWQEDAVSMATEIENAVSSGIETEVMLEQLGYEYGSNLCGPYALALLLESRGLEADISAQAEAAETDKTGTSLSGLLRAATEAGLTVYAEKVDTITALNEPLIAHLTEGHYVFVSLIKTDKVVFEDVSGERTVAPEAFNEIFSGYAITVRNLDDGGFISQEDLDTIRGGTDDMSEDVSGNNILCINQDNGTTCCYYGGPSSGGGAGGTGTRVACPTGEFAPGPQYSPGSINMPGVMSNPASPNPSPNISFGGKAVQLGMGTNNRALTMKQTDFSVNIRAAMPLKFERMFYNPWGWIRDYAVDTTRPYKNNCGNGWRHNFNVHLRVSSENGYVAFLDALGNFKRFVRESQNQDGYDIYKIIPMGMDEDDTNTLRRERAMVLKRNVTSGAFELAIPGGITCLFSAPIHSTDRYCRLESFEDASGNEVTLTYDNLTLDGANFGRLSRVDAPDDDGRYLDFTYSSNLITTVELCTGEGVNREVLQSADYDYDDINPNDSGHGTNWLRSVQKNDDVDDVVSFEYDHSEYDNEDAGTFPSKITDKEGNELLIEFEYGIVTYWEEFVSTTDITLTYPNDLVTEIEKTSAYVTEIRNYDGATQKSKFVYLLGDHGVRVEWAIYYYGTGFATPDLWIYAYDEDNHFDLTGISKINSYYEYNDEGRATRYRHGDVYYRYEYENTGDLYPYRMYGPGLQSDSYKGPMTEFVYDSSNRIEQIKPPNMGSNGITITYDSYGQVVERENAAGNSEFFEYDDQGNMTSHTDFENNETEYSYNELGYVEEVIHPNSTQDPDTRTHYEYEAGLCSCSGGGGQVTSITLPGGAEIEFEYDNNGNMTKQIDALDHETVYEYDSMGNLVTITTEEDREQTYEYDLLGNMVASTDFEGKVTKYEYDYRGNMIAKYLENDSSTTDDDDMLVEYEYDFVGRLVKVTDGKEQDINFTYNTASQVVRTSHGDYTTQSSGPMHLINTYDSYGRLTKTAASTDPNTLNIDPIEYTYNDTTGQLTRKTFTNYDAGTAQNIVRYVDYEYDNEGHLVVLDDWASRNVSTDGHEFAYDANGRISTYTDYDGAELDYTYDNMGRVAAMDAYEANNSYEYDYNIAGQLDTLTAPGSKEWAFTYDDAGRITSHTWPNGMTTNYTYDDDGRLTGIQHKDGTTVEEGWAYTLNEGGNIRHVANAADDNEYEAWEYYYDSRDRLTEALQRGEYSMPESCYVYAYDKADNMTSKIKYDAQVYNRFYDTDEYFPWTPISGTWQVVDGAAGYVVESGTKAIYAPHTEGDQETWFSFQRVGALDHPWDHVKVRLRNVDANNYLDLYWLTGYFMAVENVSGGGDTALPVLDYVGEVADVWYDVYVQLDDDAVVVYAGERGQAMTKIVDTTTNVTSSTDRIQFTVENLGANGSQFLFDDIKVMTRELSDKTMAMTYGAGNQLTNIVRGDGVEIDLAYDAWGRVSHADMIVPGVDTFTMDYTYWFGDKLKRVESDIPGMPAVVHYLYDGLGKRRLKLVDNEDIIHYRWDAGYSVLAEYEDGNTTAWDIEGFKRFFVPFAHMAFAESEIDYTGNPNNASYNYLAQDHLGTGRFAYNQGKAQVGMVEHDPYGERINQSGYLPYHEYVGYSFDLETGAYYTNNHHYYPALRTTGSITHSLFRWSTDDFFEYYCGPLGWGAPLDWNSTGWMPAFKEHPQIQNGRRMAQHGARMASRETAARLCKNHDDPCDCVKKGKSGKAGVHWYSLMNPLSGLFILGNGRMHSKSTCDVSANCCRRTFVAKCDHTFSISDWFDNPFGWVGLPGNPCPPFRIYGDFEEKSVQIGHF